MTNLRVYLCPGDQTGWAVDEDRRQTALALEGVVQLVDNPADAQVIHSCWWAPLMRLSDDVVAGKPVVCHMAGEPARCLADVEFMPVMRRVTHWIAQSTQAAEQLRDLGAYATLIPYAVDLAAFSEPEPPTHPFVTSAIGAIPHGAYVIANFHRDAAGFGLNQGTPLPKRVKGPDIFVEILAALRARGANIVALLAGPRRHWVRRELDRRKVPFVFAGTRQEPDDYPRNILSRQALASLYPMANLVLSCGRSEGGPRSVLEAAAARVPQLATNTGMARDVLAPACVFRDPVTAVDTILDDIHAGTLRRYLDRHYSTVQADHTFTANRSRFRSLYETISAAMRSREAPVALHHQTVVPLRVNVSSSAQRSVCLWNKFTPPPWGGGNQFMLALKAEAERQGYRVGINGEGMESGTVYDGHILNSVQFDQSRFESLVKPGDARIVHRIDGPIGLLRGTPESMEQDRRCFEINATYATSTVIQSWHTMRALRQLGFAAVNPILIHNACDPTIFSPPLAPRLVGDRLRVVATCWSPSPGKGAAIYEWMAWNLSEHEFELTYVGNCPIKLPRWKVVPPLPSEELATLLHGQDVYVTASRNDPCSNALIEALACGLPALYLDSGGHPELAGFAGLRFEYPEEIPGLLRRIRDNHALYRSLRWPANMRAVAFKYLRLACGDPEPAVTQREAELVLIP